MNKIIMIEDLKNYNNKSDFEQSIDLLKDFLIDENTEVFLKEENAFGINEDFIKCNLHYVAKLDKGKIEIYSNEHPPAHFHFNLSEYKGSYEISTGNKINGNIPRGYEKKLILWYKNGGKKKLIEKWNNTRPNNCPVGKI